MHSYPTPSQLHRSLSWAVPVQFITIKLLDQSGLSYLQVTGPQVKLT